MMRTIVRGAVSPAVRVVIAVFLAAGLPGSAQGRAGGSSPGASVPVFQGVYTGTIGDKAIVMEVGASSLKPDEEPHTEDGGRYAIEGRYFYRSHRVGILLEGDVLADGSLRLKEYPRGRRSGAEWKVVFNGRAGRGTFCKCDAANAAGQRGGLMIALTRVSKEFDDDFDWSDNTPNQGYYDLLLDAPLKIGPEVRESGLISHVMRTDTQLGVSMPRITRFPDRAVMRKVNDDLDAFFRKGRAESGDASFMAGILDEAGGIMYFSRDFMSIIVCRSTYYAGTMHPDYDFLTVTYDMRTGERFDMDDFFIPPEEVRGAPEEGPDSSANNLERVLAELYLKYQGNPQESCDEDKIRQHASSIQPYFDRKGLALQASDIRFCGHEVIVPWAAIGDLVRKDRVFQRVLSR